MASIQWHIGCSGFHYKEWKEAFYPKGLAQKNWFGFYAQHFNTLELNVTFYRFPTLALLEGWHAKAPPGFTFSAKVPRDITHLKKFRETEAMLQDFYGLMREGLQEHLACILFQLPPSFSYSEERLQAILQQLDPAFKNVVEFRNASWWRADVQQQLAKANTSFCGVSFPGIVHDEAVANTSCLYYRFHGVPVLFHSAYEPSFIDSIHQQISEAGNVKEAFVYFNNTASGAAIENARYLIERAG